jgi:hypothetical protein
VSERWIAVGSSASTSSHWLHHDEAERVNQLLIDFFAAAVE